MCSPILAGRVLARLEALQVRALQVTFMFAASAELSLLFFQSCHQPVDTLLVCAVQPTLLRTRPCCNHMNGSWVLTCQVEVT